MKQVFHTYFLYKHYFVQTPDDNLEPNKLINSTGVFCIFISGHSDASYFILLKIIIVNFRIEFFFLEKSHQKAELNEHVAVEILVLMLKYARRMQKCV